MRPIILRRNKARVEFDTLAPAAQVRDEHGGCVLVFENVEHCVWYSMGYSVEEILDDAKLHGGGRINLYTGYGHNKHMYNKFFEILTTKGLYEKEPNLS